MTIPDTHPADTPSPAAKTALTTVWIGSSTKPTTEPTTQTPRATTISPQRDTTVSVPIDDISTVSAEPAAPLPDATCPRCGAGMTGDEAALNKKYIGRHVTDYLCPACLGERLGLSVEDLHRMIEVFRRQGCRLFSPLETPETRKP